MTVKQLIEKLSSFPDDYEVIIEQEESSGWSSIGSVTKRYDGYVFISDEDEDDV